jgi:bacterial/archaeal transporter family-2 protein
MNLSGLLMTAAFATGAMIPLQLAFNAQLGGVTRSPFTAGLIVFLVGSAIMTAIVLAFRARFPSFGELAEAPKTIWLGGLIASVYVLSIVVVSPRLGVGVTTAFILAGQIVMAMLLDHFGLFGNPQHSLNLWRAGGAALMMLGIIVIKTH